MRVSSQTPRPENIERVSFGATTYIKRITVYNSSMPKDSTREVHFPAIEKKYGEEVGLEHAGPVRFFSSATPE
jgi:hypothetical protein